MKYELIKGFRRNANVLWSPDEKFLYTQQCERNGKVEYICYQRILYDKYIVEENRKKMKKKKEKNKQSKKNKKRKKKKNKREKNKKEKKVLNCTARVKVDSTGQCSRNKVNHSHHHNHESLKKDMMTKNNIIDRCLEFKNVAKGLPIKVPANDIFTLELSK